MSLYCTGVKEKLKDWPIYLQKQLQGSKTPLPYMLDPVSSIVIGLQLIIPAYSFTMNDLVINIFYVYMCYDCTATLPSL